MRIVIRGLLLLMLAGTGALAHAGEITEARVKKMLAEVDRAIPARDVAAIDRLVSGDVTITMSVNVGGRLQRVTLGKSQYMQILKNMWAAASAYQYRRTNQRISIQGNQAIVTALVRETVTINGETVDSQVRETSVVEEIDGRLQTVSVSAISLDDMPGQGETQL